ncbi:hypothetical protein Dda_4200 [Drechslerella dactyloides]|uniref:Uncharacterized protein n=1 Tax=Drechslerella dactyloides TaxID=74499 RepID=A0AAD6IZD5_DREDA|nr:hypothetical protein Dda_4200 [Drechslerella dactyloides]
MPCTNDMPCIRTLKIMDDLYTGADKVSAAELRHDWSRLLSKYQESEKSIEAIRERRRTVRESMPCKATISPLDFARDDTPARVWDSIIQRRYQYEVSLLDPDDFQPGVLAAIREARRHEVVLYQYYMNYVDQQRRNTSDL